MDKIISETLEKEKYLSERDVMRLAILRDEKLVLTGKIERLVVIRDEINQEIKEIREGVLDEWLAIRYGTGDWPRNISLACCNHIPILSL